MITDHAIQLFKEDSILVICIQLDLILLIQRQPFAGILFDRDRPEIIISVLAAVFILIAEAQRFIRRIGHKLFPAVDGAVTAVGTLFWFFTRHKHSSNM